MMHCKAQMDTAVEVCYCLWKLAGLASVQVWSWMRMQCYISFTEDYLELS